jgi:hypothetical protein
MQKSSTSERSRRRTRMGSKIIKAKGPDAVDGHATITADLEGKHIVATVLVEDEG